MRPARPFWIVLLGISLLGGCGGEPAEDDEGQGVEYSTFSAISSTQVAIYARNAGIPCGERLRVAVAVAYAESGYNTSAYNLNTNGTVDKGLWQINTYYHPPTCDYYDPVCNAQAMARISSGGTNWKPWYGYGTSRFWSAYSSHARTGAVNACNGSVSTPATSSPLSAPFLFDAGFYLYLYGDLRAAFGNDHAAARQHWETYGIKEGRVGSIGFDVRDYLARYSDLRAAFGTNYRAAINHWLKYGIKEGRRTSRAFDVHDYLTRHPDLTKAFGSKSYAAAINHWLKYGIKEGRQTASDFYVRAYLARYPDLKAAFGTNYRAAFHHWHRYGAGEGRNPGP